MLFVPFYKMGLLYILMLCMFIQKCPGWCGSVDWVPACECKGPQLGVYERQPMFLSLFLLSPLSKNTLKKKFHVALARSLSWLECSPIHQKRLQVQFPVWMCMRGNWLTFLSLPSLPSSLKINKYILRWELKKKKSSRILESKGVKGNLNVFLLCTNVGSTLKNMYCSPAGIAQ